MLVLSLSSPALAQNKSFNVAFSPVSNNCKAAGASLSKQTVAVDRRGKGILTLTVAELPVLRGKLRRGGKFRAKTRKAPSKTPGVTARYSAGGSVDKKEIRFLFIAEYYKAGKPLCTQSWSAAGKAK